MEFCRVALTVMIWLQRSISCFTVTRNYKDTFDVLMLTEIANVTMHIIIQRKCVCAGISKLTPLHLTIIKTFSVPRSNI